MQLKQFASVICILCLLCVSRAWTNPELWAFRVLSAGVSYLGLVGVLDGAKGWLSPEIQPYLRVAPSQVDCAGLGLYVRKNLEKGTVLGHYVGAVIPMQQAVRKLKESPECQSYIWRFADSKYVIDPTDSNGLLQDTCVGGNAAVLGSTFTCENILAPFLAKPTTLCRINEPPRGLDVNVATEENLDKRYVQFQLERDVLAGEELFIDYGMTYDRSQYNLKVKE